MHLKGAIRHPAGKGPVWIDGRTGKLRRKRPALPLPPGMTWNGLQEAIERRHPAITRFLRSGEGIRLQRKDSDIAEAVMVAMMERGILVLPIHDSFLVDYRYAETLREEMTKACRDHLGTPIEIEEDPSMIEGLGPVSEEAVDRFMAAREASPGYEQYRARGEAFRPSRSSLAA